MNQVQKGIFVAMLSFGFLTIPKYNLFVKDDNIKDINVFHAKFKTGYVYIGTNEEYEEIKNYLENEDVFIVDERTRNDPNLKVLNSYKISDIKDRGKILKIMASYEKLYPSSWNRSIRSMLIEWEVHNVLYNIHYQINRTKDVDFNNADEEVYRTLKLKR